MGFSKETGKTGVVKIIDFISLLTNLPLQAFIGPVNPHRCFLSFLLISHLLRLMSDDVTKIHVIIKIIKVVLL